MSASGNCSSCARTTTNCCRIADHDISLWRPTLVIALRRRFDDGCNEALGKQACKRRAYVEIGACFQCAFSRRPDGATRSDRMPKSERAAIQAVQTKFATRATNFDKHIGRAKDKLVRRRVGQIELQKIVDRPGRFKIANTGLEHEYYIRNCTSIRRRKRRNGYGRQVDGDRHMSDMPFQLAE